MKDLINIAHFQMVFNLKRRKKLYLDCFYVLGYKSGVNPKSPFCKWLHINQTQDPEYQSCLWKCYPCFPNKNGSIIKFPENFSVVWAFGDVLCLKSMHFKMQYFKKKIFVEKLYHGRLSLPQEDFCWVPVGSPKMQNQASMRWWEPRLLLKSAGNTKF